MSKRSAKRARETRVNVPRSRLIAQAQALSLVGILGILLVLCALDVRLGQGFFAYRWSPVRAMRTLRAAPVIPIAALVAASIGCLSRRRSIAAGVILALALLFATTWLWWCLPQPVEQHAFSLRSLSADGAFVMEAESVSSISQYLRSFEHVLKRTPAQMGGTRVLSNPPGTIALAWWVLHLWPARVDPPGFVERVLISRFNVPPEGVTVSADSLKIAAVLVALWGLVALSSYFLGRLFLSRAGAVVFAVIASFNPCVILFVPGKDPAQLLTINLMLLGWLAAWARPKAAGWSAALAGMALTIGSTFGLIHIWVALAALIATTWDAASSRDPRAWIKLAINALCAAAGAALICLLAYTTIGWNIPAQLLAVSQRWSELQSTFKMSRPIWYLIGLPIFLLFLSPGLITMIALRARRPRIQLGGRLVISTASIMLLTYLMGVTYELPRLWVAFLPALTLGAMADLPLMKFPTSSRRVAQALILIVCVQMIFTACHWTLFDVREAEYRLITRRFYR